MQIRSEDFAQSCQQINSENILLGGCNYCKTTFTFKAVCMDDKKAILLHSTSPYSQPSSGTLYLLVRLRPRHT